MAFKISVTILILILGVSQAYSQDAVIAPKDKTNVERFEYAPGMLPEHCFFPSNESRWDGYSVFSKEWDALSTELKLKFISEGIEEIQRDGKKTFEYDVKPARILPALDSGVNLIRKELYNIKIPMIKLQFDYMKSNWRLLNEGMQEKEVKRILGAFQREEMNGDSLYWFYPYGGQAIFNRRAGQGPDDFILAEWFIPAWHKSSGRSLIKEPAKEEKLIPNSGNEKRDDLSVISGKTPEEVREILGPPVSDPEPESFRKTVIYKYSGKNISVYFNEGKVSGWSIR